ncbi:MAG: hypothetical protein QOF78_3772 [Phycisphaerales bacterium]|nr:hypothetical protein [Phycisphaerales bacterium]
MPARPSKRPRDVNQLAKLIVDQATGNAPPPEPDTRNPAAVALSKLGASKGGKARAKSLTKEQRKEIARKAAAKRWGGKRKS